MNYSIVDHLTQMGHKDSSLDLRDLSSVKDLVTLVICRNYGITEENMMRRTRKRPFVEMRQLAMFCLSMRKSRTYYRWPLEQIGKALGGYDHATVLHCCNVISNVIQVDIGARNRVLSVVRDLSALGYHYPMDAFLNCVEKSKLSFRIK
jgi:chromosomal replication initiation ATPase DnaA